MRRGRSRRSMFDPYITQIKELLDGGCTYQQIADRLENCFDDAVNVSSLAAFCKRRGLRSLVTQGCRNGRIEIPNCNECQHCKLTQNSTRTKTVRVCDQIPAIISRSVLNSPMDCPKRDFEKYCEEI